MLLLLVACHHHCQVIMGHQHPLGRASTGPALALPRSGGVAWTLGWLRKLIEPEFYTLIWCCYNQSWTQPTRQWGQVKLWTGALFSRELSARAEIKPVLELENLQPAIYPDGWLLQFNLNIYQQSFMNETEASGSHGLVNTDGQQSSVSVFSV